MTIEIEEVIGKLLNVHRTLLEQPALRREADALKEALDGLRFPTEPRERRFTLTFSLEGDRFTVKKPNKPLRMNVEEVLKLLNQVCGYVATGRNTTQLFVDEKGELFGELRVSWRDEKPR